MSCFSKNRWELGLHTSGFDVSPGKHSAEEKTFSTSAPGRTEDVDIAKLIKYTKLFINNQFVESAGGPSGSLEVENPFNASVIASVRANFVFTHFVFTSFSHFACTLRFETSGDSC
jgi:hypothetical protein